MAFSSGETRVGFSKAPTDSDQDRNSRGDGAPSLGRRAGAARRVGEGTHVPPVSTPCHMDVTRSAFPPPHLQYVLKGTPCTVHLGWRLLSLLCASHLQRPASAGGPDTLPAPAGPQPESLPRWPPWSQGLESSYGWVHPAPSRGVRSWQPIVQRSLQQLPLSGGAWI